jgi:hypothetical protein
LCKSLSRHCGRHRSRQKCHCDKTPHVKVSGERWTRICKEGNIRMILLGPHLGKKIFGARCRREPREYQEIPYSSDDKSFPRRGFHTFSGGPVR